MQVIQLYSFESANISSAEKIENCNCNEYLKLGNYKINSCQYANNEVLLQFKFDSINFDEMVVEKAYLDLNIASRNSWMKKNKFEMIIGINEESFDPKYVNWENKPKIKPYKTIELNISNIENNNNNIKIEITDLINMWKENKIPNYGITLKVKEEDLITFFLPINGELSPRLTIYTEAKKPGPISPKFQGMELQARQQKGKFIENDQVIKFDTIVNQVGKNLSYDDETNEIIILETGVYIVQWWLSIDGIGEVNSVNIELMNNDVYSGSCSNAPIFVLGQVNGTALVTSDAVPVRLKLLNKSNGRIEYANIETQASLVVFKI